MACSARRSSADEALTAEGAQEVGENLWVKSFPVPVLRDAVEKIDYSGVCFPLPCLD